MHEFYDAQANLPTRTLKNLSQIHSTFVTMMRKVVVRVAVFVTGFGFVAGSVLFALAYFTVDVPDANAYVNSQSTIFQYSNGEEIGRVGTQNRQIVPLAKIPLKVRQAVLAA